MSYPRYFVPRANLYVCQRMATGSVAVSVRGKDLELSGAVERRVKPHVRLFDEKLGDVRHGNQWYPGFYERRLELYPSSARDYINLGQNGRLSGGKTQDLRADIELFVIVSAANRAGQPPVRKDACTRGP